MSGTGPDPSWIPVGIVARPHGVRGELRVHLFNASDQVPASLGELRVTRDGHVPAAFEVCRARAVSGAWLVTLRGIDTRDAAEGLRGGLVSVSGATLPPAGPGQFYLFEVIGARVEDDATGAELGTVAAIVDNHGQDLLVISTPAGDRTLPLVDATLAGYARERRTLRVRPIPGLWDA